MLVDPEQSRTFCSARPKGQTASDNFVRNVVGKSGAPLARSSAAHQTAFRFGEDFAALPVTELRLNCRVENAQTEDREFSVSLRKVGYVGAMQKQLPCVTQ